MLLQPPTTHLPCILQWFWHTVSHVSIYFQKQNIVIPEVMSEANLSHSRLFLSCEHRKGQLYKHWKFIQNSKNSHNNNFFCSGDQEKKEIYVSEKFLGLEALKYCLWPKLYKTWKRDTKYWEHIRFTAGKNNYRQMQCSPLFSAQQVKEHFKPVKQWSE